MQLPASELLDWEEYFSIFPFNQDRADLRVAMLASTIANMSGKQERSAVSEKLFLPNYLHDTSEHMLTNKSVEQQHTEFRSFTATYRALVKETSHNAT